MYHFIDRLHTLYGLLQDEQSKEIFQARFAVDMEKSFHNIRRLVSLGCWGARWAHLQKDVLKKLNQEQKKIILYGTANTGQYLAGLLQFEHIGFCGFCGRGAEKFPDGLLGKPVLSPDELVAHADEYYVVPAVTTKESYTEISELLQSHNYPKDHILDWFDQDIFCDERQYFDFPALYHRGTAFVDAGCFDCGDSYKFAEWCGGAYSSIIAFEPDPRSYDECCKRVQEVPLPNFQLVNAGLSSQEGVAEFDALNAICSHIAIDSELSASAFNSTHTQIRNKISIRTVAMDDIVGARKVGFIKMDIEGAELNALRGAKNTILRDKPLLAVCVYHLRGDVFAIMDYLHHLLPEYRFLLRHYGAISDETVLYASVDL